MSDNSPGLKRLRNHPAASPIYACSNCKCKRFSPCTCSKGITSTSSRSKSRKV